MAACGEPTANRGQDCGGYGQHDSASACEGPLGAPPELASAAKQLDRAHVIAPSDANAPDAVAHLPHLMLELELGAELDHAEDAFGGAPSAACPPAEPNTPNPSALLPCPLSGKARRTGTRSLIRAFNAAK
jgi:hypothetical protein